MVTYVPDLNVMIYATEDCERQRGEARERCTIRRERARKALEIMKGNCKYAKLPRRDTRKYEELMKEYQCEPIKLSKEDRSKVDYFKNLLRSETYRSGKFYFECTEKVGDGLSHTRNVMKSMGDDWEIVGKSFLAGDDVVLVTEDNHIKSMFCRRVYEGAAEVAGIKRGKWDVATTGRLLRQILQSQVR